MCVQYTKINKAQNDYFRYLAEKDHPGSSGRSYETSEDLVMITTTLKVAEMSKITYEEFPNYTKEALVADIGGALGFGFNPQGRHRWLKFTQGRY